VPVYKVSAVKGLKGKRSNRQAGRKGKTNSQPYVCMYRALKYKPEAQDTINHQ
jgi:hypothetical protein